MSYKYTLECARNWLKMFPEAEPIIAEIDKQLNDRPKGYFWMAGMSGNWDVWEAQEGGIYNPKSGNRFDWGTFDDRTERDVWKWEAINKPSEVQI